MESFHNTAGSQRYFDATWAKTTEYKRPHFNWWDHDNCFIAGVKKVPQYTFWFWALFFKVAANLGNKGKQIVEANSPEEIKALRTENVRLVVQEGSQFINVDRPLISAEIRAMIDNIWLISVYGH